MKFYSIILLLCLSSATLFGQTQIGINETGESPNTNAALDAKSSTKGMLFPRMNATQRASFGGGLSTTDKGMIVFDTDEDALCVWDGANWIIIPNTGDNFGGHTATENIQLNGEYLVHDGNDTKGLYIADGGLVGVHTTAPQTTLEVDGSIVSGTLYNSSGNGTSLDSREGIILSDETSSQYLVCTQDGNGRIQHKWNATYGTSAKFLVGGEDASFIDWTANTNAGNWIDFKFADGSAASAGDAISWNTHLSIADDGNVGIGVDDPQQALHVSGGIKVGEYTLDGTDGNDENILSTDGAGAVSFVDKSSELTDVSDSDSDTHIYVEADGADEDYIRMTAGGTEALVITNDKYVGVHTEYASSVFDYSNIASITQTSSSNSSSYSSTIWQSFTPETSSAAGVTLEFYIRHSSSIDGDTESIYLYEGQGTSGTLLATSSITFSPTSYSGAWGWSSCEFTGVTLEAGTVYTVDIDGTNSQYIRRSTSNPYSGGRANSNSSHDYCFKVYYSEAPYFQVKDDMVLSASLPTGIGTDAPTNQLHVSDNVSGSDYVMLIENTTNNNSSTNDAIKIIAGHSSYSSSNQSSFIYFEDAGGSYLGRIKQDGGSSIKYHDASDMRLKENIQPTKYGLNDLLKIQVKDYNYIGDSIAHWKTGYLAQQLYTAYPTPVDVGSEDVNIQPWGVDYGKVSPLIVQSIQDEQKIIDKQEEDIKALLIKIEALQNDNTTASHIAALQVQLEELSRLLVLLEEQSELTNQ